MVPQTRLPLPNSGSSSSPTNPLLAGESPLPSSPSPRKWSFHSKPPLSRLVKAGREASDASHQSLTPPAPGLSSEVLLPPTAPSPPANEVATIQVASMSTTVPSSPVAPLESTKCPVEEAIGKESNLGSLPLKGAWAKKLHFASSSSSPREISKVSTGIWPSLQDSQNAHTRKQASQVPEDRMEDDLRFPWAAKMNPTSRNLYRAVEPEYLQDGTPKVTIPQHVLLQGLENQKEYILGHFYRCSTPPGGLIHAVLNKIWGRNCQVTIRKLGNSNYLFHIPDKSTRKWVLERGLWHVDDCLLFVAAWTPGATLAIPEFKTIPVWVTLKNIPNILYSIPGISHIASGLGAPMATHKPQLDPILMGEAKILVEVELSKEFPPKVAASDTTGFISMVDVEYAWLPSKCSRCGQLGHKIKRCLQLEKGSHEAAITKETTAVNDSSNVVSTTAAISVPDYVQLTNTSATAQGNEVLETMSSPITYQSPLSTTNDTIETPMLESAQPATTPIAQALSTVQKESGTLIEPDFGSNKFGSLISLEGEDDSTENESDSLDLMTPSGKRILRERPVKPSTKAKEMVWQTGGRGRGNRGRGTRGGRG